MLGSYTVKVLSSGDFDNLGYEHTRGADISGSVGFADALNNRAYVRDTGVEQLNKYLVNHEFEHLLEEEGTDEDSDVPGIRHKFWIPLLIAAASAAASTAVKSQQDKQKSPDTLDTGAFGKVAEAVSPMVGEKIGTQLVTSKATQPQVSSPQTINVGQPQQQPRLTELAQNISHVSQPGAATSPLNLFGSGTSTASPRTSDFQPGLNSGIGGGLTPQQLEKQKGQYAGRLVF